MFESTGKVGGHLAPAQTTVIPQPIPVYTVHPPALIPSSMMREGGTRGKELLIGDKFSREMRIQALLGQEGTSMSKTKSGATAS